MTDKTQSKKRTSCLFCNLSLTWPLEFAVNGASLPNIGFDVGESYAGSLPIGDANPGAELFYWFFPSTNVQAVTKKEVLFWVTGGVSNPSSQNIKL